MFSIKKGIFAGVMIGISMILNGCTCQGPKKGTETKPSLVVVNVLDKEYHDNCHIAGSINVPFAEVENFAPKHWDKETELVFYCANYKCTASGEAAKMLKNMGYKHVWAYEGGVAEWKKLGYPVEGPCKADEQHAYLNDMEKPTKTVSDVSEISAEELKAKMSDQAKVQCTSCCPSCPS